MRDLAATQQLLWQLITAPEGTQSGVEKLDAEQYEHYRTLVRGGARLSTVERIDVYANMYFFRLLDCLREDYPAVARYLGDDRFHNLVTDYLVAHPPRHFSLRHAGDRLPQFLADHAVLAQAPYSAALARFEWALVEAFDAPDAAPVEAAVFGAIEADRWAGLRLLLTPSLQVIETTWAVEELWEDEQGGEPPAELLQAPTALRIWRHGTRVRFRRMNSPEPAALLAVCDGATFGDVCGLLAETGDETLAADAAASLLAHWVADGLVVGVS